MVETFDERAIITGRLGLVGNSVLSLGRMLIFAIAFAVGYFLTAKLAMQNMAKAIIASVVAGVVAGLVASLLIVATEVWNVRAMFTNASPALIKILTFSQPTEIVSALTLIGTCIRFSVLGAIIYSLPSFPRQIIMTGLIAVLLVGVLQEFLSSVSVIDLFSGAIFVREGLSITGAIIVFVF